MQKNGKFILTNINEFKEWLSKNNFVRPVKKIQIHHTAVPSYKDFKNNHFEMLKGMEYYHVHTAKMAQIAQNITIFPDSTTAICRPFEVVPAGIFGSNTGALCIEIVGNFDIGGDTMTAENKKNIVQVVAALCKKFAITPNEYTIIYHHWFDLTNGKRTNGTGCVKSCPGTNFFGGNSVESAKLNFIPLVKAELAKK